MKQYEAVIEALTQLGGIATLGQIYKKVFTIEDCQWNTKTPMASVRRIVRHTKGIMVVRKGLYALEDKRRDLEKKAFSNLLFSPQQMESLSLTMHIIKAFCLQWPR
ncbi:MAG: hypothetical protein LIO90_07990 [Bacteroidales bacterium]|nr:hypothetical protein [Bacteroidales bacterium]